MERLQIVHGGLERKVLAVPVEMGLLLLLHPLHLRGELVRAHQSVCFRKLLGITLAFMSRCSLWSGKLLLDWAEGLLSVFSPCFSCGNKRLQCRKPIVTVHQVARG